MTRTLLLSTRLDVTFTQRGPHPQAQRPPLGLGVPGPPSGTPSLMRQGLVWGARGAQLFTVFSKRHARVTVGDCG